MGTLGRIVPVAPTSRPTGGLYTIGGSEMLPRINATRTVKSAILSPSAFGRCNALLHRYGRTLTFMNIVASFLVNAMAFYPAPVGRWIAVRFTPLTLPPTMAVILGLRFEMVGLVLGTFDFWYQGFMSVLCPILFALYTHDIRAISIIGMFPTLIFVLFADANYRATRFFFATSVLAAILCIADALLLMFGGVDQAQSLELFDVYGHTITAQAVMAHGLIIIAILHIRNAYVRRQFATSGRTASTMTISCVLYRSRLCWRESITTTRRFMVEHQSISSLVNEKYLPLHCQGLHQVFDARRTLFRTGGISSLRRLDLAVSGGIGFTASIASMGTVALGVDTKSAVIQTLGILGFVLTMRVWLYFICYVYKLEMLRLLHTSLIFGLYFFKC